MRLSALARWSPVSGVLSVVLWIVTLIVTGNDVSSSDSDAKILAYYADSGHRHRHIAGFFLVLAALLFYVWFLSVLRGRLARAEGGAGGLTTAAFGAGLVTTALWMVSIALFSAPAATREDTSKFHLNPDTYRIINDMGYGIFFSATTFALITVVATSLLGLSAGVVPRWLAWLGLVVAATLLVSFLFLPFLIFLGWLLVVSVVFLMRDGVVAERSPPPAVN
jgi:hypothetical protein